MSQADVLSLFNCLVVEDHQWSKEPYTHLIDRGLVLDFIPTIAQGQLLEETFKPLRVETVFTREEREEAPLNHLLAKQFLHYFEVYGLGAPGIFDMTVDNGSLVSVNYVAGITVRDLEEKIETLLYTNAPVKDAEQIKRIMLSYPIRFDINKVANNELRAILWTPDLGAFTNGDDAVRHMCWKATGQALLIKSKEVMQAVKYAEMPKGFFDAHTYPLAQVFNRHKALILAAKNSRTRTAINRISRLSKTQHVPVRESIAKTFIHKTLTGQVDSSVLDKVSLRDKLKYLNVLAEKKAQLTFSVYKIRNGKVWYDDDPTVYGINNLNFVEQWILNSLGVDLHHLRFQNILLDTDVDYGLPISRKQTLGRLPYGTRVISRDHDISAGMYWENAWGAHDLDLSGVKLDGSRIGWGGYRGYTDTDIIYSGDVTNAPNGAMEFLTSRNQDYGLIVNIYSGIQGSEMELVVGRRSEKNKQWMDEPVLRERHTLESRQCLLGFVKGRTFTVYSGRMNNRSISGVNPTLQMMQVSPWTLQQLFATLNIHFDVDRDVEKEYDHDLSYFGFSYDKLEDLLKTA